MKKTITILTPTYNEVGNIDEFFLRAVGVGRIEPHVLAAEMHMRRE